MLLLGKEEEDGGERDAVGVSEGQKLSVRFHFTSSWGGEQLTSVADDGNTRIFLRRDFSVSSFGFCTTINSIEQTVTKYRMLEQGSLTNRIGQPV